MFVEPSSCVPRETERHETSQGVNVFTQDPQLCINILMVPGIAGYVGDLISP